VGEALRVAQDKGARCCCGTERVTGNNVSCIWARKCSDASAREGVGGCDGARKCCLLKWAVGVMGKKKEWKRTAAQGEKEAATHPRR
jgi:hypothetical protein